MGSSPDDVDPVTPHALISHDVPHMQGHVRFHRPAVFYNKVLWKMVDDARDDLFVVYNDRFATDQAIDQTGIARHVAVFAKPIGYEVQLRIRRQIGRQGLVEKAEIAGATGIRQHRLRDVQV